MIIVILSYLCASAFLMTMKIHGAGDEFYTKQLDIARRKREDLKQKLQDKKISPFVYVEKMDELSDKNTIRTTLWINYILSPVLSPVIVIGYIVGTLTILWILIKNIR